MDLAIQKTSIWQAFGRIRPVPRATLLLDSFHCTPMVSLRIAARSSTRSLGWEVRFRLQSHHIYLSLPCYLYPLSTQTTLQHGQRNRSKARRPVQFSTME